mmetsp:Transcript_78064/g.253295  ORF Transcript_78064/g.253295 Transcript_78064/m.253295 type:complete len:203 (-) Transcript_78064:348-956(-)
MGSSCSWFGVGVQCEELRVLLECGSVVVVVVRCFRLRASVFVFALGARVVLHDVRTSILARLGGQRFLRRFLRVFDARGACGHRPAVARCQACDRAAVVASLRSLAVLLSLVRCAHRDGCVVRRHELLRTLHHVWRLRGDGHEVPQYGFGRCWLACSSRSRPCCTRPRGRSATSTRPTRCWAWPCIRATSFSSSSSSWTSTT